MIKIRLFFFSLAVVLINILGAKAQENQTKDDSLPYRMEFPKINLNFLNFESPVEAAAAKMVFRQKICHLACRVGYFNQFVSQKITDIDLVNNSLNCEVSAPHHFTVGLSWFEEKNPLFCDFLVEHEMAHLLYDDLPQEDKDTLIDLYDKIPPEKWSVFAEGQYLYKEGEEKTVGFLLGHPGDSADEMFASAFALAMNLADSEENIWKTLRKNLGKYPPLPQIVVNIVLLRVIDVVRQVTEKPMIVCNMWK